jgi:hypothetical protein
VRRLRPTTVFLFAAILLGPGPSRSDDGAPTAGPPPRPPAGDHRDAPAPPDAKKKPKEESHKPEAPWHIPEDLRTQLARTAERYKDYALRFTCLETVRLARYDEEGEASNESMRRYAYLLEREADGETLHEYRQKLKDDGSPRGGEVRDEEPFPPAYTWVQLFSPFEQSFFVYRDLGERIEGYDWVREIEFRGALPFTDGKDIRQWEGTVLVDAVTFSPIEIHAQPTGQDARIRALYDRWSQSFKIIGLHTAPRPLLYGAFVQFGLRKDGLTFPTEMRYDTRMAVSAKRSVPRQASSRRYEGYQFFKTATSETPGAVVSK